MEPRIRRAVILIPRVVDTENTGASHVAIADSTMQTAGTSCSDIIKREPRSRTTLLSGEQSTSSFDTDDREARLEEPFIPKGDMAFRLKQGHVAAYYNNESANKEHTLAKQKEHETREERSVDEAKNSLIEKGKQTVITKQVIDDENHDSDDDSNANGSESMFKQDKDTVYQEDQDTMTNEFVIKHDTIEVGKGEITLHQETPGHTSDATNDQGYIYKCARCPHRTTNFILLMKHRQTVHNGRDYEGTSIKHLHLNPILNDPNHHCRACERRFPNLSCYRTHLRLVHHIPRLAKHATQPTMGERSTVATTSESNEANHSCTIDDPQKPKFSCSFCCVRFNSMLNLTRHEINDHQKQRDSKAAHCIDSNTQYKSTQECSRHRRPVHNADVRTTSATTADIDTDTLSTAASKPAGPKITCKLCGMGFESTTTHLIHYSSMHRVYTKRSEIDTGSSITNTLEHPSLKRRTRQKAKTVRFMLPDSAASSSSTTTTTTNTAPFRCKSCDIPFDTRPGLTRHRWSVHRDTLVAVLDKEEDHQDASTTDAKYRCRSCLVQCESRSALTRHLSIVHNNFDYSKKSAPPLSSTKPKTNLQCNACSAEFDSRSALAIHLWAAHPKSMRKGSKSSAAGGEQTMEELQVGGMNTAKQGGQSNYCSLCKKKYKNWHSYRSHLYSKHRESNAERTHSPQSNENDTPSSTRSKPPASSVASPLLPDINDPNFYCHVCDKTLRTKSSFLGHLLVTHSNYPSDPCQQQQQQQQQQPTTTAAKKRTAAVLDVDDPNNYCAFCERTFSSQDTFHQHVRSQHHIKRRLDTTSVISTVSNHSSDASSSKGRHFCTVCHQRQATLGQHRQHLRLAHKVKLPPVSKQVVAQFRYPDEFIDIESPDLYCAQCDHYFSTKMFFNQHIEGVHRMSLLA